MERLPDRARMPAQEHSCSHGHRKPFVCVAGDGVRRFDSGEMRRQVSSSEFSELLLPKVKISQIKLDARGVVRAWRWELELNPRRKETNLPLRFTFEAAQTKS